MVSDEKRREVARRLRELDYSDLQESLICAYLDALGIEGYADWVEIAHRLADLIEPQPTCRYYDPEDDMCLNVRAARPCGREALLELADDLDRMGDGSMYDASISDEYGIARRIRKALGAVE